MSDYSHRSASPRSNTGDPRQYRSRHDTHRNRPLENAMAATSVSEESMPAPAPVQGRPRLSQSTRFFKGRDLPPLPLTRGPGTVQDRPRVSEPSSPSGTGHQPQHHSRRSVHNEPRATEPYPPSATGYQSEPRSQRSVQGRPQNTELYPPSASGYLPEPRSRRPVNDHAERGSSGDLRQLSARQPTKAEVEYKEMDARMRMEGGGAFRRSATMLTAPYAPVRTDARGYQSTTSRYQPQPSGHPSQPGKGPVREAARPSEATVVRTLGSHSGDHDQQEKNTEDSGRTRTAEGDRELWEVWYANQLLTWPRITDLLKLNPGFTPDENRDHLSKLLKEKELKKQEAEEQLETEIQEAKKRIEESQRSTRAQRESLSQTAPARAARSRQAIKDRKAKERRAREESGK